MIYLPPTITSVLTSPATVAAVVTALIGLLVMVFRFFFDVSLITRNDVEDKIQDETQDDISHIIECLETTNDQLEGQGAKLDKLEDLIVGGEYELDDGMIEVVNINREAIDTNRENIDINIDDIGTHESRITNVERLQLKIRRRQAGQGEEEAIVDDYDTVPVPADTDDTDDTDDGTE